MVAIVCSHSGPAQLLSNSSPLPTAVQASEALSQEAALALCRAPEGSDALTGALEVGGRPSRVGAADRGPYGGSAVAGGCGADEFTRKYLPNHKMRAIL